MGLAGSTSKRPSSTRHTGFQYTTGGFHHHVRGALTPQPIGQPEQAPGGGVEAG